MLRKLAAILFTIILVAFSTGCPPSQEAKPRELPKIPKGYESRPGFGGMGSPPAGETKPPAEQGKADAPAAGGEAPAGAGAPAAGDAAKE